LVTGTKISYKQLIGRLFVAGKHSYKLFSEVMLQVTMFVITIYDVYRIITAYSSLFNWNMLSTPCLKKLCKFVFFLSELRQISTNFDNFWQKHGKEAKIM